MTHSVGEVYYMPNAERGNIHCIVKKHDIDGQRGELKLVHIY